MTNVTRNYSRNNSFRTIFFVSVIFNEGVNAFILLISYKYSLKSTHLLHFSAIHNAVHTILALEQGNRVLAQHFFRLDAFY